MFLKREPDAKQQGQVCRRKRSFLAGLHQFPERLQFSRFHVDTIHLQAIGQRVGTRSARARPLPELVDEFTAAERSTRQ